MNGCIVPPPFTVVVVASAVGQPSASTSFVPATGLAASAVRMGVITAAVPAEDT